VFFNQTLAKAYVAGVASGIFLLYLWSNKHMQVMYLLKRANKDAPQKVGIMTYSNFGLSYNRIIEVPVTQFRGSRLLGSQAMNLYFLEYAFHGRLTGLTKKRTFFYRPEFVANRDLWKEIKTGNEILTFADVETGEQLDELRQMKKKSPALKRYK